MNELLHPQFKKDDIKDLISKMPSYPLFFSSNFVFYVNEKYIPIYNKFYSHKRGYYIVKNRVQNHYLKQHKQL